MITEWVIRINNPNLVGDLTRIRLKDAQLALRSTAPIWLIEIEEIKKLNLKNNLNTSILVAVKDIGISIKSIELEKNWNIALDNKPVNEIRMLLPKEELKRGAQHLRNLNLWCLEQITTRQDNTMFTWQQIKLIRGVKPMGKTP